MPKNKKTILLVEDDPFLKDIYSTQLKSIGIEAETAENGEECLLKIKKNKPDILVLDLVLPKTNGWEVLGAIKKDEKLKDLKIIILSNLGQKREVEEALDLGVCRYLIKAHYTPAEVASEIKKILEE